MSEPKATTSIRVSIFDAKFLGQDQGGRTIQNSVPKTNLTLFISRKRTGDTKNLEMAHYGLF